MMDVEPKKKKKKKKKRPTAQKTVTVASSQHAFQVTLRDLSIEELAELDTIDERFKLLMIKFASYLRGEGYQVSTDALLKFFQLYDTFDIFSLDEMIGALRPLIAKDKTQYETFSYHFERFFYGVADHTQTLEYEAKAESLVKQKREQLQADREAKEQAFRALRERLSVDRQKQEAEYAQAQASFNAQQDQLTAQFKQSVAQQVAHQTVHEAEMAKLLAKGDTSAQVTGLTKRVTPDQDAQALLKALLTLDKPTLFKALSQAPEETYAQLSKLLNEALLENIQNGNRAGLTQLCMHGAQSLKENHVFLKKKQSALVKTIASTRQATVAEAESALEEVTAQLAKEESQMSETVAQFDRQASSIQDEVARLIVKERSQAHRPEFTEGKNSVQTLVQPSNMELLGETIEAMDSADYERLTAVIRANATKFKTKISRDMMKDQSRRFNYSKTMKSSLKTFGIPLELFYEKPRLRKTKIVCILDVSGSTVKSSKLLLNFLYELSSVFKGGIRSYVFVKELTDVSEYFQELSLNEAIEQALVAVPRTYSNYYYAFETFHREYLHEVDKNTIVLFLGDARNNQNKSGVEFLNAIKHQAKACIWLNTEEKAKWNVNDSIIGLYSEYMNSVHEILTTHDLIHFLEQFKLK